MTSYVEITTKIPNRSWHSVAHDATRYSMKTYQLLISTTLLTTLLGCAATATEEEDQGSSVESLTETAAGCAQLTDCIYRKTDEDRGGRNPYEARERMLLRGRAPAPRDPASDEAVHILSRWYGMLVEQVAQLRQTGCAESSAGSLSV